MHHLPLATITAALCCITAGASASWNNPTKTWGTAIGTKVELAGRDLNGTDLNGGTLDGRYVTSVSLSNVELDGVPMLYAELAETVFTGIDGDGHHKHRNKFIGATFEANLDDGSTLPIYVSDIQRHPDKANKNVFGYELWYETATSWEPLCGEDADGHAILAIPLGGAWSFEQGVPGGGAHIDDPSVFTFGCEGYAIAKCVVAGYQPWNKTVTCVAGEGCEHGTLADHHQACTRALRADYFGDGNVHTNDGVAVNFYDGYGVRFDSEDWPIEAEWDANGAICVGQTRLAQYQALLAGMYADDCGDTSFFDDGTLLVTEAVPSP